MRRVIVPAFILLFSAKSFSQQVNHDYLNQSKKQKKMAWIFLGAGTALIATSIIYPNGDLVDDGICFVGYCDTEYENDGIKTAFFVVGTAAALTSIPFFITSKSNKRKAASVGLKMDDFVQPFNGVLVKTSFPALRFRLNL